MLYRRAIITRSYYAYCYNDSGNDGIELRSIPVIWIINFDNVSKKNFKLSISLISRGQIMVPVGVLWRSSAVLLCCSAASYQQLAVIGL